jgi:hypothetical protein
MSYTIFPEGIPQDGGKKIKRHPEKQTTRRRRALFLGAGVGAALPVIVLILVFISGRASRPVWYVDETYSGDWVRILQESNPAAPFTAVKALAEGEGPPPKSLGFVITTRSGMVQEREGKPVQVYPWLARTLEWNGALVLAADPWMVFRKQQDPDLSRQRVDALNGGQGTLILPGGSPGAVTAWLGQLLQTQPGIFPQDRLVWQEAEDTLFYGSRFQHGARTYRWIDVWPLFFRDETAWVYAPLSLVRGLSSYRMGLLEASAFPGRNDWNEYGVQADILWAVPLGEEKNQKTRSAAEEWLKDPGVQTVIANTINWIPGHPSGTPYNPVSWQAQLTWMRSSFVWQGEEYAEN